MHGSLEVGVRVEITVSGSLPTTVNPKLKQTPQCGTPLALYPSILARGACYLLTCSFSCQWKRLDFFSWQANVLEQLR